MLVRPFRYSLMGSIVHSKVTQEEVSSTVFLAKSTHEYIRLTSGYHYAILCVADILQVP